MKPSLVRPEMRSIEHARGLVLPQPLLFLGMPRIRSISSHAIVYVGFAPIASVVAAHRQLPSLVSIVLVPPLVISAGCALCYWGGTATVGSRPDERRALVPQDIGRRVPRASALAP